MMIMMMRTTFTGHADMKVRATYVFSNYQWIKAVHGYQYVRQKDYESTFKKTFHCCKLQLGILTINVEYVKSRLLHFNSWCSLCMPLLASFRALTILVVTT